MNAVRGVGRYGLRRGALVAVVLALAAVVLAAGGRAGAAQPGVEGHGRSPGGLRYTASQAGYVTGGGRYFRFVSTRVTVAAAPVAAGGASSAEVVLASAAGPPVTLRVAAGGGTGSVTYTWSSGTQTRTAPLSGLAPAPGDALTLSVYYDQKGQDSVTATDITQGSSRTAQVRVVPVIYTAAEVAAEVNNATVTGPAAGTRLWAFSSSHVTTYTGVRGTLLGRWATYQVIDTTTGTPSGAVVISAPVLRDRGQNFAAWLRAASGLHVSATIAVGGNPQGVAVNPATSTVYVANTDASGTVSVISEQTRTVTATIPVGISPEEVAVNPATNMVYVTNMGGGTVSVISGQANTVVATIPVGTSNNPEPRGIAVNPGTNTIYVANQNDGTVSVISGQTNTVVATIAVGPPGTAEPVGVAVNPATSTVYVANPVCCTKAFGITVIDARANTVTATISAGSNSNPHFVAADPQTDTIYATNPQVPNTVSVINGQTNRVTASIPVGDIPQGVAVNPASSAIYVANEFSGTVSAISGPTQKVIATVPVGTDPFGITANPATNTIYVTNWGSDTVSVLTWSNP